MIKELKKMANANCVPEPSPVTDCFCNSNPKSDISNLRSVFTGKNECLVIVKREEGGTKESKLSFDKNGIPYLDGKTIESPYEEVVRTAEDNSSCSGGNAYCSNGGCSGSNTSCP